MSHRNWDWRATVAAEQAKAKVPAEKPVTPAIPFDSERLRRLEELGDRFERLDGLADRCGRHGPADPVTFLDAHIRAIVAIESALADALREEKARSAKAETALAAVTVDRDGLAFELAAAREALTAAKAEIARQRLVPGAPAAPAAPVAPVAPAAPVAPPSTATGDGSGPTVTVVLDAKLHGWAFMEAVSRRKSLPQMIADMLAASRALSDRPHQGRSQP